MSTRPYLLNLTREDAARIYVAGGHEPDMEAARAAYDREVEAARRAGLSLLAAGAERAREGESPTVLAGLAAAAAERGESLPAVARALAELGPVEAAFSAEVKAAEKQLAEANAKLAEARARAVGIVNGRQVHRENAAQKQAEVALLEQKRALLVGRRTKARDIVRRKLVADAHLIGYPVLLDAGAVAAGIDVALAELDAIMATAKAAAAQAEAEREAYETRHARELEEVPLPGAERRTAKPARAA